MQVDQLIMGAFETNCYALRESDGATDCVIVDAGLDGAGLVGFLQERKLNAVALVLTHGHADHIAGVVELRKSFANLKVYIHQLDAEMLTGEQDNLSALAGGTFRADPADFLVVESDRIEQAEISLEVLHTPGHTRGGISLYCRDEGVVFAGDTLFAGSVGRTDFPGGNMRQLITNIREKLLVLPDETVVYPGHGPATTIAQEKAYNPFVR
jgi:glyoxylase-like metal-dependent hydrolase (beta-lactamase superfamily II)